MLRQEYHFTQAMPVWAEGRSGEMNVNLLFTGTLWENDTPTASCNHGFASHVICWLTEGK